MPHLIDVRTSDVCIRLDASEPTYLVDAADAAIAGLTRNGCLIYQNRQFFHRYGAAPAGAGPHIKEVSPDLWRIAEGLKKGRPIQNHRLIAVHGDGAGEPIGYFFVCFHTDAAQAEPPIAFDIIPQNLPPVFADAYHGLYLANAEGYTVRVNASYEKIACLPEDEVRGKHLAELQEQGYFSQSVTLKVIDGIGQRRFGDVSLVQQIITGKAAAVTGRPLYGADGRLQWVLTYVRELLPLHVLAQKCERFERTRSGPWPGLGGREKREPAALLSEKTKSQPVMPSLKSMIVAADPAFLETLTLIEKAARCDAPILLLGETGVGKDRLAKCIHAVQAGKDDIPFVPVNCPAIPEELFESELFGYEEGAFSGARKGGKAGLFEAAHGGVLFLNEISEIPLSLQAKLLSVLDEGMVRRVGATRSKRAQARIVCATNRDPAQCIRDGSLREDLYHRISVLTIRVPPLRDRKGDILPLMLHFMREKSRRGNSNKTLSPSVQDTLISHHWPGNVRELRNVVETLFVFSESDLITISDLPRDILNRTAENGAAKGRPPVNTSLKDAVARFEAAVIQDALQECGSAAAAARHLGIDPTTLMRKLKRRSSCTSFPPR